MKIIKYYEPTGQGGGVVETKEIKNAADLLKELGEMKADLE